MTLEDHQASRWIAEPCMHLLDCCQETDGSVALVITSVRTRGRAQPHRPSWIGATRRSGPLRARDRLRPVSPGDLSVMDSSVALARRLFERSGL